MCVYIYIYISNQISTSPSSSSHQKTTLKFFLSQTSNFSPIHSKEYSLSVKFLQVLHVYVKLYVCVHTLRDIYIKIGKFIELGITIDDLLGGSSIQMEEFMSPTSTQSSPKNRIKFLCSHGGKILPRPADGHLKYVGGETRVISVPRDISFPSISLYLSLYKIWRLRIS